MQIRRPHYLSLCIEDTPIPDWLSILGSDAFRTTAQIHAVVPPSAQRHELDLEQLKILRSVPCQWMSFESISPSDRPIAQTLIDRGILWSDTDERHREDDHLYSVGWEQNAALYHFAGRWEGVDEGDAAPLELKDLNDGIPPMVTDSVQRMLKAGGTPPSHRHRPASSVEVIELPSRRRPSSPIFDVMYRRASSRRFTEHKPLDLERFATLMRTTFGAQRLISLAPDFTLVKKTSPSAGALSVIEAYPIVSHIDSLPSGIYHYDALDHRLAFIAPMERDDLKTSLPKWAAGQTYVRGAHVNIVVTARYARTFWKYRQHSRAYRMVAIEAGHILQTAQLAATALNLGTAFTGAINDISLEGQLALSPSEEGIIGILSLGLVDASENAC